MFVSTYSATQLVQIRETKRIGAIDKYRIDIGNV